VHCPACHKENPPGSKHCEFCRTPLPDPASGLQQTVPISGVSVGDTRFGQGSLIAGRYLVERELGRGGMGVVYLVRDQQLRGKEVALKLISAELTASPLGRDRFIQEVLAAQELQHPNIIRVFHLDEASGQCFFTMEYVPGTSLRKIIEDRKREGRTFTLEECLSVLVPVLEALHHAHAQSSPVIHRDIKPDNIMVAGDLSSPQVKVLDFGLAKMLSPSKLTSTAVTMGTAYYMAPEQVQGARDIDQRADLFSVGVVLYEMLTGRIPSGRFKLPTELNRELPAAVDVIVDKALQQEPSDRFATAKEFASSLEAAARVSEDASQGQHKGDVSADLHTGPAPRSKSVMHNDSAVEEGQNRSSMTAARVIIGVFVLGAIALLTFFLMRGEHSPFVAPVSVPASALIQEENANETTPVDALSQPESKDEAQVLTDGPDHGLAPEKQAPRPTGSLNVSSSPDKELVTKEGEKLGEIPLMANQVDVEAAGSEQDLTLEVEAFGHLFVNTVPKDAAIKIFPIKDKFEQGMALKPGRYELRISAPGHVERNEKVEIAAGEEKRLDFELQKDSARLKIEGEPVGASVQIDGLKIGELPSVETELPPGKYAVTVSKDGHVSHAENIELHAGGLESRHFSLLRAVGSLRVDSNVEGARIRLSDRDLGTIPGIFHDIEAGDYEASVTMPGFRAWVASVVIEAGSTARLSATLEKNGASPLKTWREPLTGMEFVWVPAGTFMMGSEDGGMDEKPVHKVTLSKGFWMGRFEVTQAQWGIISGTNPGKFKGDDRPVENVSISDCFDFIRELNKRSGGDFFSLPTEAQWEYAARSGGRYERYSGGNNADAVAWHSGNSGGQTRPVGLLASNGLGIHDMSGNVMELCADIYSEYSSSEKTDPIIKGASKKYPTARKPRNVLRGGSWKSNPSGLRCTFRDMDITGVGSDAMGFRLVRKE